MPEQALHAEERHAQLLVLPAGWIVALRTQAALGQDFREWRNDENREWGTPSAEAEALESLTCNSELTWIDPSDTGDLTDAPMLGILGDERHQASGPCGVVHTGRDAGGNTFTPILERWAFMDYQLRTFLDDLTDTGKAVFVS